MTDNECRCRIREASTARLRILDGSAATAVDVTYSVDANTVVIGLSAESRSDIHQNRHSALLEIVHDVAEAGIRWRVLVTGMCEPLVLNSDRPADLLALRIDFLEGRHGMPEALPPGSLVPRPRHATT
jgi:hypothetical protein